jgi:rod shape-determining protein MreC
MQPSRDDFVIAVRSAFLKKENKQKFSLLVLILLTIIILTLGKYNFKAVDYLKISLKEVAYRSSFIVSIPEKSVKNFYEKTKDHFSVYNENIQLKKDLKDQVSKNYNIEFILAENERLKRTIDDLDYFSDEILAKVLIDKQSPFLKSIILNKGSKDKVLIGMAVLDDNYLVGKVVDVTYSTSRVLLLSDLNSKIPVDIMPSNIKSILSGTGEDYGIIQYLKNESIIENESKVFTSGAGDIFKSGIPIGKIVKKTDSSTLNINFYSDFSQLRFVKLISFKKKEN